MSELKKGDPVFVMTDDLYSGVFLGKESVLFSKVGMDIEGETHSYANFKIYEKTRMSLSSLYNRLEKELAKVDGQKTIVFNALRDLEHAEASAEEGKE